MNEFGYDELQAVEGPFQIYVNYMYESPSCIKTKWEFDFDRIMLELPIPKIWNNFDMDFKSFLCFNGEDDWRYYMSLGDAYLKQRRKRYKYEPKWRKLSGITST